MVEAFTIPVQHKQLNRIPNRFQQKMLPDTSSILTAVEVFDGSTIVDPVVVSDVFWTSLKSKILAVVIGQILATIVFGFLASFLASQLSQLGDFVSKTLFSSSSTTASSETETKTFIKASDIVAPPPDFGKLLICLAIDVIGSSSELIPILGEATDVVYAPIAASILRSLEFAEEILPFTDILPLATIW